VERPVKIIVGVTLGVAAGLLVLGIAAAAVAGAALAKGSETEPERIAAIGTEIADYAAPAGYGEQYGFEMGGFSVVTYDAPAQKGHLIVAQAPSDGVDQATLDCVTYERVSEKTGKRYDRDRMHTVSTKDVVVRGEPAALVVREGQSSNGRAYREVSATFQGKGGPAMAVMAGPTSEIDEANMVEFLGSMK
jgi:hypothetical protein